MKVYFCPVGKNNDLRVTHVVAGTQLDADEFEINSNVAKTIVESVVSKYPELQDTQVTVSWLANTIEIIPGNPALEELYDESCCAN